MAVTESASPADVAEPTAICTFCGMANWLPAGGDHPCCTFARVAGQSRCAGCVAFAERQNRQ